CNWRSRSSAACGAAFCLSTRGDRDSGCRGRPFLYRRSNNRPAVAIGDAPARALDLDPVALLAGAVGRVALLRNDALEAHALGSNEELQPIAEMFGEAKPVVSRLVDNFLERELALHERQLGEISAVEMQEIEGPKTKLLA